MKQPSEDSGNVGSLRGLNGLPRKQKENIYRDLIPPSLLSDDRRSGSDQGEPSIRYICPPDLGLVRVEVRRTPADSDCLFFMQAADTPYGQLELTLCIINDIDAPRFNIDRDAEGRDNCLGTLTRNIPEEIRAMEAGLCPHQVRPGLGLFRDFMGRFDRFAAWLGMDTMVAEPLSYNTAILYEQLGFDYLTGYGFMKWIDREFQPGGELARRLDGSTPFRQPDMGQSVRGRSWAIHDGILRCSWDGIRIYKTVGRTAAVSTFPDGRW
ncbi:hypothetical protein Pcar_1647 [Syntrophotalea carbinolica DSM 2380]|uniref:Uncharacterized protein n=2 Tax=Syntrophotalea carbinolica TaxID=19 RepID=Q3A416_SYNC1|nr:hypothetical protein Pcar_1647 [Syntrophotalea carbinolica DSM 2380]